MNVSTNTHKPISVTNMPDGLNDNTKNIRTSFSKTATTSFHNSRNDECRMIV